MQGNDRLFLRKGRGSMKANARIDRVKVKWESEPVFKDIYSSKLG